MRRLTGKVVIAALAIGGGYAGARALWPAKAPALSLATPAVIPISQTGATGNRGSVAMTAGAGDATVAQALDYLERRPNIAAKVRQAIRLEGQQLTGSGAYWQQGRGNQRRTCWQLQTLADGETTFCTQVFDGGADKLWTDRRTEASRTVTTVDLQTVRRELTAWYEGDQQSGNAEIARRELLARGGMTQLLAELLRCFTFSEQRSVQRGERTVMSLIGQWRSEELARQWPALAQEGTAWPAHLPHHVLLQIGSDDFFPYLVEYRDIAHSGLLTSDVGSIPTIDPLASYEFIDVHFAAAMPQQVFVFEGGPERDVTAKTLERLQPTPPPPAATGEEQAPIARRFGDWR